MNVLRPGVEPAEQRVLDDLGERGVDPVLPTRDVVHRRARSSCACTSGWMSDVACGPMRCAPSSRPVSGRRRACRRSSCPPSPSRMPCRRRPARSATWASPCSTHSCSVSPTVAICGWLKMPAGTWSCGSRREVVGVHEVVRDGPGLGVGDVLELVGRADVAEGPDAGRARAAVARRRRPARRRAARMPPASAPRSAVLGWRPVATSSRSASTHRGARSSSRCSRTPSPVAALDGGRRSCRCARPTARGRGR